MFLLISLILVAILSSPLLIWALSIRPYCFRHGRAYTPGATWWITLWIDWQNARELALEHNNGGIRFVCALFFLVHSIYTLLFFIALMGKIF